MRGIQLVTSLILYIPVPAAGKSNPLQNNTGVDFSMFTIPNSKFSNWQQSNSYYF
jgi:hypothetical protein